MSRILLLALCASLALADDSPRHDACTAADEAWKATCEGECPDDATYTEQTACKEQCGKDATKLYWSCSTCWTTCDKTEQECEAGCPIDSMQEGEAHDACVKECQATRDACTPACKEAVP
jgi:hypothetical protein